MPVVRVRAFGLRSIPVSNRTRKSTVISIYHLAGLLPCPVYVPESQRASVIIFNLESSQIRKAPLSTIHISGRHPCHQQVFPFPQQVLGVKKASFLHQNGEKIGLFLHRIAFFGYRPRMVDKRQGGRTTSEGNGDGAEVAMDNESEGADRRNDPAQR